VNPLLLNLLDHFFLLFHGAWVALILFAWLIPRLRGAHLVVCFLTFLSWLGLGLVYGLGYCPFTDWHWQILQAKGETQLPRSYLVYVLDRFAGIQADPDTVDFAAVLGLLLPFLFSLTLWWRDRRRNRSKPESDTPDHQDQP